MSTTKLWLSFIIITVITIGFYIGLYEPYAAYFFKNNRNNYKGTVTEKLFGRSKKSIESLRRSAHLDRRIFNISSNDIMVFLHIQKTGGTYFGKNLVRNLVLERACIKQQSTNPMEVIKRFDCMRPHSNESWLYSRYSTGWFCGLHADWTTLIDCLPRVLQNNLGTTKLKDIRLFYVSLLRDPVNRFLSEFKHVQRGATWKTSTFFCNGTKYVVPTCFKGSDWRGVQLQQFLDCPYNLAFNRQTRMLANLSAIGCYNYKAIGPRTRDYEKNMLQSAKNTLRSLSYFGLLEYQSESQYLFEMTFGLKFQRDFRQVPDSDSWSTDARNDVTPKQLLQIRKMNRLDRQLYSYSRTLFFKRLKYFEIVYDSKPKPNALAVSPVYNEYYDHTSTLHRTS